MNHTVQKCRPALSSLHSSYTRKRCKIQALQSHFYETRTSRAVFCRDGCIAIPRSHRGMLLGMIDTRIINQKRAIQIDVFQDRR